MYVIVMKESTIDVTIDEAMIYTIDCTCSFNVATAESA